MEHVIKLGRNWGAGEGFRRNLPLERELGPRVVIDATALGACHPAFLLRLRLFLDWHLAEGHDVTLIGPADPGSGQQLADLGLSTDLPSGTVERLPQQSEASPALLPIRRLHSFLDVEQAAEEATGVLLNQAAALATWGDALYMAISELCDNAIQHGASEIGAYVVADRVTDPQPMFRLAIADLGIGIPEHIRARHPEWVEDSGAIARALQRGVTGTGDPHRGNGFAEVFDKALERQLVRAGSAVILDVRAGRGRVRAQLVGGVRKFEQPAIERPRRGTWISYTVVST